LRRVRVPRGLSIVLEWKNREGDLNQPLSGARNAEKKGAPPRTAVARLAFVAKVDLVGAPF